MIADMINVLAKSNAPTLVGVDFIQKVSIHLPPIYHRRRGTVMNDNAFGPDENKPVVPGWAPSLIETTYYYYDHRRCQQEHWPRMQAL